MVKFWILYYGKTPLARLYALWTDHTQVTPKNMKQNILIKSVFILLLALILTAGGSIPYLFESPSILYKTGLDKFLLRTGKIAGIAVVILMVTQLFFIANLQWLTPLFKTKNLYRYHRINGLILLAAAIAHPILILGADHFVFFPLEYRYWPEILGLFLLVFLVSFVLISVWRGKMGISYPAWKRIHRIGAVLLFFLVFVHVHNVSETFAAGVPFYSLCAMAGIFGLLILKKFLR